MSKLFGYILSPVFYFFFGLTLCIFHPIQWICHRFFGYKAHKVSVDILNFFLTYCQVFLLNSVIFKNDYSLPTHRPIIFVANHQSMYDIPTLIWFLRRYSAKFISKIELTKGIPSISINLRVGGGANINRKDNKQAISEIIKLGRRMQQNNWSTVIFPEGTRAKDGQVKTFQFGGIATLLKAVPNALVVPVAIENSWKIVRFGMFPLTTGNALRWTVLNPIDPEGKTANEITLEAETEIRKVLGQEMT
ncbi:MULTISPECIES: lysophospholipid acyltransferase family protein [unclassified Pedobacter]|jgi:1-acyl-sn-glycerol-3-phosphate acyltransferase|uniref:lysophospholipid acyltransferase family protein n=1 Tax=Pedobacter TaxID=84567 RepID=UPI000B4A60A8|nr:MULTISPECIES: lysophospholipid acyltransferase family protein [unclassified Pedobacter]MCX2433111.1 lysophospholipid acyltransferase family protein [Pedobacter sp. GR22-10]MCX2586116.1 lysophospholipid acyltransferase family protein [Pedobacter sp. MR22-3]OWK69471.1 1-acyl-sn-glycerol-3-phosphate acyltransferase [Pedobacter sp. AJM]